MRQKWLAALMIPALLLAACGGREDEQLFSAFRAGLETAQIACEAEVAAGTETETETFTLSCAETAHGTELSVLAPEVLSGVTATADENGAALHFDGVVVPVPERQDGVSPLLALPVVLSALRQGHPEMFWREGDLLAVQLTVEDDLAVRVLFSDAMLPVFAEVILAGGTAARCTFRSWTQTEREESHEPDDPNLGGDQSQHPGA